MGVVYGNKSGNENVVSSFIKSLKLSKVQAQILCKRTLQKNRSTLQTMNAKRLCNQNRLTIENANLPEFVHKNIMNILM